MNGTEGDQFVVTLPSNIVAQIDARIGSEFTDREDFMLAAARHYLEYLQDRSEGRIESG